MNIEGFKYTVLLKRRSSYQHNIRMNVTSKLMLNRRGLRMKSKEIMQKLKGATPSSRLNLRQIVGEKWKRELT